jgi:hypothetical protein
MVIIFVVGRKNYSISYLFFLPPKIPAKKSKNVGFAAPPPPPEMPPETPPDKLETKPPSPPVKNPRAPFNIVVPKSAPLLPPDLEAGEELIVFVPLVAPVTAHDELTVPVLGRKFTAAPFTPFDVSNGGILFAI